MKSLRTYTQERIDEGLISSLLGVPSMEDIMWMVIQIVLAIEAIKFGAHLTFGFVKGFFSAKRMQNIGNSLGDKAQLSLIDKIGNIFKKKQIQQQKKSKLEAIAKEIKTIKQMTNKDNMESSMLDILRALEGISQKEVNEVLGIVKNMMEADKDRAREIAKALELEMPGEDNSQED